MTKMFEDLQDLIYEISTGSTELSSEKFELLFNNAEMKYKEENYPDIFKKFFLKLSESPFENKIRLQLLLIVTCQADMNQRV